MSHSVTIQTRTVTTGSPSSINVGFCKSWAGLLKIAQVILGIISVVIVFYAINNTYNGHSTFENLFFLLVATSFMMTSLILVLSSLCSFTTESIITKTIFELLYHALGFALLLAASVTLLTRSRRYYNAEKMELTASILSIINSILYFITTIFALRTSRAI
ncbi:uncharacterized protein LOC106643231 isoform X1 [Copidosoma floridanum]|uniref:uncharacterized protein LOC106643231 isoform X1 n=1 Tax=Copidosoma floridanum TaxID=29053 RepID=UPI0006C9C6F7|nr:uncharacterized protein LOC106643231 isoform X1 [Copidosoma floridanum]XP_014213759.1 uncharacterized protein LOC106643231 isoform X1 [Copidosoma floridanum]